MSSNLTRFYCETDDPYCLSFFSGGVIADVDKEEADSFEDGLIANSVNYVRVDL